MTESKPSGSPKPRRINLALQGGGSHGAFTWGVCERLLEDHRIEIDSITGTSAGAINAGVLASGYADNGRAGAIGALGRFWNLVGAAADSGPLQRTWFDKQSNNWRMDYSPAYLFFDLVTRMISPYEINPTEDNPLRSLIESCVDVNLLRHNSPIKLHIGATNVRTGRIKVFTGAELSVDALLASACLPLMFKAVAIDGEHYWDGGFMGNPAIYPLTVGCDTQDVVLVQINPLFRHEIPKTARAIQDRVNEISFNSTLMREMRAIHFVTRLVENGRLDPEEYKTMRVHLIANDAIAELGASSKVSADRTFLDHLRWLGRNSADRWIDRHWDDIGERSTIDLAKIFL